MTNLESLIDQGITRVRLPRWNEHAYLLIREGAIWADLYDVLAGIGGGEPTPMLVADCARHTDWEPASADDPATCVYSEVYGGEKWCDTHDSTYPCPGSTADRCEHSRVQQVSEHDVRCLDCGVISA